MQRRLARIGFLSLSWWFLTTSASAKEEYRVPFHNLESFHALYGVSGASHHDTRLRIDRLWDFVKEYAGVTSSAPPPVVVYVDRNRWKGEGAIFAEYFEERGEIELYRTLATVKDAKFAAEYIYAVFLDELFHHALTLQRVTALHHCVMAIDGFAVAQGGAFIKLLHRLEKEGLLSAEARAAKEKQVQDACTRDLGRLIK